MELLKGLLTLPPREPLNLQSDPRLQLILPAYALVPEFFIDLPPNSLLDRFA